jgi:hypothetical protein
MGTAAGRPLQVRTDVVGGLVAVHLGHLQVHQDHLVLALLELVDGLNAVFGNLDLHAPLLQEFADHQLVHLVVFHQQDARVVQVLHGRLHGFGVLVEGARLVGGQPEGELERKHRAQAHLAAHADLAALHLDDSAGDGEAQPGAAVNAGGFRRSLRESCRRWFRACRSGCRCRCRSLELDRDGVLFARGLNGLYLDEAFFGEFQGVAHQVEQDLVEPHRVAGDDPGSLGSISNSRRRLLALAL